MEWMKVINYKNIHINITNMKRLNFFLIILFMCFFLPLTVSADGGNGNTLYCYSKSSMTPIRISLDELDKMTFSYDGVQIWTQNGMEEYLFDDILLFTFTEIEHPYLSAVESDSKPMNLHFRYIANQRKMIIESCLPLSNVCVYDIQGQIVSSQTPKTNSFNITLPIVPSGVYLVKVVCGGKFIVKKFVF